MKNDPEIQTAPTSAPTTTTLEPISLAESARLIALEKVIDAGKQPFIAVGNALAEIRDAKLYRSDFKSFEDYCQKKWGFTKQHAYRLIKAAPIAASNLQVTSLNQANELTKVPSPKRAEVIKVAATNAESAGRAMTAMDIKVAAQPVPVVTVKPAITDARPVLDFTPAFELLDTIMRSALRRKSSVLKKVLELEACLKQLASTAAALSETTSSNN